LSPALKGPIQKHNLALAVAALDAAGAIRDRVQLPAGAAKAYCPGRFERRGQFILDGAHNPQAAEILVEILRSEGFAEKSLVLLTSMVNGHESEAFYRALAPMVKQAVVGPIDFHRAQPPEKVADAANRAGIPASWFPTLDGAIAEATALAEGDPVLVAGSFYFLGDVGNRLVAI
jgi:dihydrofolate synthase/folylpolyglutamate synthase